MRGTRARVAASAGEGDQGLVTALADKAAFGRENISLGGRASASAALTHKREAAAIAGRDGAVQSALPPP